MDPKFLFTWFLSSQDDGCFGLLLKAYCTMFSLFSFFKRDCSFFNLTSV